MIPDLEKAVLDELKIKSSEKEIFLRNKWDEI